VTDALPSDGLPPAAATAPAAEGPGVPLGEPAPLAASTATSGSDTPDGAGSAAGDLAGATAGSAAGDAPGAIAGSPADTEDEAGASTSEGAPAATAPEGTAVGATPEPGV
jgi:hypothetical protein